MSIFFLEPTSLQGATSSEGCATAASGVLRGPGTRPFSPSCSGKAYGNVVGQLMGFFQINFPLHSTYCCPLAFPTQS